MRVASDIYTHAMINEQEMWTFIEGIVGCDILSWPSNILKITDEYQQ